MNTGHLRDDLEGLDHFDLLGMDPRTGREPIEQLRRRARDVTVLLQRGAPPGQTALPVPFTLQQANAVRDVLNHVDTTGWDERDADDEDAPPPVRLTDRELVNLFYARYDIHNRRVRSSWNPFAAPTTGLRLSVADPAIMRPVPGVQPSNSTATGASGPTFTTTLNSSTGFFGGPSYTTTQNTGSGTGQNTNRSDNTTGSTGRGSANARSSTANTGPNTPTGQRRRTGRNAFGSDVINLADDDEDDVPVLSPSAGRPTGRTSTYPSGPSGPPSTPASGRTGPAPPTTPATGRTARPPRPPQTPTTGPAFPPTGFVHIPRPPPGMAAQYQPYAGPVTPAAPAPAAPPPVVPQVYTGRTDYDLPTLELRAGDPAGNRVVIGLVRPVDGNNNVLPAAPVLVATVGADRLGRVNYRIIGRDINGATTAGAGRNNSLNFQQLQARGLVLLGRFARSGGATEGEIRTFATDRSARTNTNSPLPLADRSPRRGSGGGSGYTYTPTGKSGPRRSRSPSSPSGRKYRSRDPPAGGAGGAGAGGLLS